MIYCTLKDKDKKLKDGKEMHNSVKLNLTTKKHQLSSVRIFSSLVVGAGAFYMLVFSCGLK